jgi:hypothetical protein
MAAAILREVESSLVAAQLTRAEVMADGDV